MIVDAVVPWLRELLLAYVCVDHRASLVDKRRPEAFNCGIVDRSGVLGRQVGGKHRPAQTVAGHCASSALNSANYLCHRILINQTAPRRVNIGDQTARGRHGG
jgi:hypothetical protein